MVVSSFFAYFYFLAIVSTADGFLSISPPTKSAPSLASPSTAGLVQNQESPVANRKSSALHVLLNVPDGFFTLAFPALGVMSALTKQFNHRRTEERAWEQRVEEARLKRLREDPTLTEIELRRKEASTEWSAYGKPRMDEERAEKDRQEGRGRRVNSDEEEEVGYRQNRMTDDEIALLEAEFGVDYDPYYDDPYTEEELPNDIGYDVDGKYGDRIYKNGEIFYKDKATGSFYRQGAKPKNLSFWS
jgi:hypothetical protein